MGILLASEDDLSIEKQFDYEKLSEEIDGARNSLSTDRLDMSFGEIMSMYGREEIIIDPDFQRLFRWNNDQQTKFIESLLLGIPIPPIFIAEVPETGQWELVDGLQRISTVLSFFGELNSLPEKNSWTLSEGSLIKALQGYRCHDLPLRYKLNIKRSVCRIEIVKWNSKIDMRYELFNRLNTLGSPLSEQELRNCIFRPASNTFNETLRELASQEDFRHLVDPTEQQIVQLYLEELVLRFFSLYDVARRDTNIREKIKENISLYMTSYMKDVVRNNNFDDSIIVLFNRLVRLLAPLGKRVFRGSQGPFSPNLYDIVMVGVALNIDNYEKLSNEALGEKIKKIKEEEEFRKVSGAGANSKERVAKRIEFTKRIFSKEV